MMMKGVWLLLFITVVSVAQDHRYLNTTQLIQDQGYPVEEHVVVTDDGFLLGVQRIPFGIHNRTLKVRPAVLLQHGLLDTSATWVLNSPRESLAFILADNGFDVWLGNSRGNRYALRNGYYPPTDPEFWNWNWDQHASDDIPATVDYILGVTGLPELTYVGHSQGATIGLACFSNNITIASKINLIVALAPVTYLANQGSPLLGTMAKLHIDYVLQGFGNRQFTPTPQLMHTILGSVCVVTPNLCNNLLGSLFGVSTNLNSSRLPVYTAHWPDMTSVQNFIHWIKNTRSTKFETYEGEDYQPSKVACPVAIYYGDKDLLADPADIQTLSSALGKRLVQSVKINNYTHMDFTWAFNAWSNVYNPMVTLITKFSE